MDCLERNTANVRRANDNDLPRILELSRMWPENFIEESFKAIAADFAAHHCCVYETNGIVQAFVIFCSTWYEIEMLWGASNRQSYRRAMYLGALIRWIEKTQFEAQEHFRIITVKMAALDSAIPSAPSFSGMASTGIQKLLGKLRYRIVSRIESFWFAGDHCIVAIKTKHQDE